MRGKLVKMVKVLLGLAVLGGAGWLAYGRFVQKKPALYPVRAATYEITVGDETARVKATYELNLGQPVQQFHTVPLLSQDVGLLQATFDGKKLPLDLVNKRLCLVTDAVGAHTVALEFTIRLVADGQLAFDAPVALTNLATITIPRPKLKISAPTAQQVQLLAGDAGSTRATVVFPVTGQIKIDWVPAPPELAEETRLWARATTSCVLQGRTLAGRTELRLRASGRPTSAVEIRLPPGTVVDHPEGAWVKNWDLRQDVLIVQGTGPLTTDTTLTIYHRRDGVGEELDLRPLEVQKATQQSGLYLVAAESGVELAEASSDGFAPLDIRTLPPEARSQINGRLASAYRYDRPQAKATLKVIRHAELVTLRATADTLNAVSAYTPDGRVLTRLVYQVRNNSLQYMTLQLPEGAELWSLYVDRKPAAASRAGDGGVLVPLPVSATSAEVQFPVEVVYVLDAPAFARKGALTAPLARADIPVLNALYTLYVPDEIVCDDFGGNLRPVQGFTALLPAGTQLRADSELLRQKRAAEAERARIANQPAPPAPAGPAPAELQVADNLSLNLRLEGYQDYEQLRDELSVRNSYNDAVRRQFILERGSQGFRGAKGKAGAVVAGGPAAGSSGAAFGGATPVAGRPLPAIPPVPPVPSAAPAGLPGGIPGLDELLAAEGLSSLAVEIPTIGQVLRFEGQLLRSEALEVKMNYWRTAETEDPQARRLVVQAQTLFDLLGGAGDAAASLRGYYRADCEVSGGKLDTLVIRTPDGFRFETAVAPELEQRQFKDDRLTLSFRRPLKGSFTVEVFGELAGALPPSSAPAASAVPTATGAPELPLPPAPLPLVEFRGFAVEGAARESGWLAVAADGDFELQDVTPEGLSRGSPAALPANLRGRTTRDLAEIYAYNQPGWSLLFRPVRHAAAETLELAADALNAITLLTDEGLAVTRVIYSLRNTAARHLRLLAPEKAELWGVFVDNRAVRSFNDGAALLVPIPRSSDGSPRSVTVELVYLERRTLTPKNGELELELPRIAQPLMRAMYSVYLPAGRSFKMLSGTLKSVKRFSLVSEAADGAASLNVSVSAPAESAAAARSDELGARALAYQEMLEENRERLARAPSRPASAAGADAGTSDLDLKIYLPPKGQLLRFERQLAIDEALSVKLGY